MEILILLTFIFIILFGLGDIFDSSMIRIGSTTLLILTLLIGWLLYGILISEKTKIQKINEYSLSNLENQFEVIEKNKSYIFDNQVDFKNIKDTTTFYIERKTNGLGIRKSKKVYYLIKNNKFYSK